MAKNKTAKVAEVKVIQKANVPERPPMGLVDNRVNSVIFETKVSINTYTSRKTGKSYCDVIIGAEQDKKFSIYARKDGKGVCVMTDWAEYMLENSPKFNKTVESVA